MRHSNTLILCLTLLSLQCNGQMTDNYEKKIGDRHITTNTIPTEKYDHVKLIGSMDIVLEKGKEGQIKVTTDENLQAFIDISVDDNTLIVRTKKHANINPSKGINVTVPFEDLSKVSTYGSGSVKNSQTITTKTFEVSVNGSGELALNIQASHTEASINGSGDIKMEGKTNNLNVDINGSGNYNGFDLEAQKVDVSIKGSGNADVSSSDMIKTNIYGSGNVTYKGNPSKIKNKVYGSGNVSKK